MDDRLNKAIEKGLVHFGAGLTVNKAFAVFMTEGTEALLEGIQLSPEEQDRVGAHPVSRCLTPTPAVSL